MRQRLLANAKLKLHSDQRREAIMEPVVTMLMLMVPAIILLRSFLLSLFIGGLWMVGVGALLVGGVMLFLRARRYARIPVYFGIFRAPEKLPSPWLFWKPVTLIAVDGQVTYFKHSLAPDKKFQANQEYLVYYLKSDGGYTLLSFAPTDHMDSDLWKPTKMIK
ncbi:MAG: hypothetical protein GC179_16435 [Anaerolineaceae bacterium]|nr:hypothetical protein [Anaerolineaceae bacterium]